jgi:AraC family transcriptional regulator
MKFEVAIPPANSSHSESGVNPPIASSKHRGWENLLVEQYHQPTSGEFTEHHPSEHFICLALVRCPINLVHIRDERVYRGLYKKGDINIAPAGLEKWQWEGEDEYLKISLGTNFVEKVATEALNIGTNRIDLVCAFQLRDMCIEHIGMTLLEELKNEGLGERLYVDSIANILAVHLLRNYSTVVPRNCIYPEGLLPHQLQQIIEYINESLEQDIKLANLAALVDMSQFHFARLFKQSMGISPHQYVIQQRVERAKKLLASSDLSLTNVALQCGFSSQSHLGKWFRQITGVTPSNYRKQR